MASDIAQFFALGAVVLAAAHVIAEQAPPVTRQTVCGKVQKVTCEEKPPRFTILELKPKSKNLPVTILSASRALFTPAPEEMYRNTEVCATGHVEIYSGHRRLVVSGPQDITIKALGKAPEVQWIQPHVRECDEGVEKPVLTLEVQPHYTPPAMEARIQGVVTLEGIVGVDGRVGELQVTKSLDSHHGLDQEAIRAVKKWKFTPATRFGQPVPILVTIEMSFRLR